jgi:hypothetical protein
MAVSKLNYIIIEDDSEMKRKESWRGGAVKCQKRGKLRVVS